MPTPAQTARLNALERQSPLCQQEPWSAATIREAIQDLLAAIDGGYDENDKLHRWAWSASDAEMLDWWAGRALDAPGAGG